MKKAIAALLTALMLLGLTACGSGGTADDTADTAGSADELYTSGQTLTIITDAEPGNNSDILTRKWAELFTKYTGASTTVVNEEAASGVVAMNMLLQADADGMTICQQSQSLPLTIAAGNAPFSADEIAPLFGLTSDSMWLSVAADSEYQTLDDLIAACRENPGAINGAGNKTKGMVHYWACMIMRDLDIDFNYIPYDSGDEEVAGVLAGDSAFMLLSNNRSSAEVAAGHLRALAVTGENRFDVTPDSPTFGELGYDDANSVTVWRGMFAKAGTAPEIMDRLEEINTQITSDQDWIDTITGMGMSVSTKSRAEFTEMYNEVVTSGKELFDWYDNGRG